MPDNRVERRLAAILSADVSAYSRLMADDEQATVRTITAYREEISKHVGDHRGRVVDATGDNVLTEFPTALEAVECAVKIQLALAERNAYLSAERRMQFRIGVHLGDVTVEGERIYGDGVNIAARLEGLAEPGGICISGAVHEQVGRKLELRCDDLGRQSLKNIHRPVRAFRVTVTTPHGPHRPVGNRRRVAYAAALAAGVLVALLAWWALQNRAPASSEPAPDLHSEIELGVPEVRNLTGSAELDRFAIALRDDLLADFAGDWEAVASRGTPADEASVCDYAAKLDVRFLLEMTLKGGAEAPRLTALLIDCPTEERFWSEDYDIDDADLAASQMEVANRMHVVTGQLVLQINTDGPGSPWWHFSQLTRNDNRTALAMFRKRADLNPTDPSPRHMIGSTLFQALGQGWHPSRAEKVQQMRDVARECLAVDSRFWGCHVVASWASLLEGDSESAVAQAFEADRLLTKGRKDPFVAMHLILDGRNGEAIEVVEQGLEAFPDHKDRPNHWNSVALAHFADGRYEEAIAWARRSTASSNDFWNRTATAYQLLAASAALGGQQEEAERALVRLLELRPDTTVESIDLLYAARPELGQRLLDGLKRAGFEG